MRSGGPRAATLHGGQQPRLYTKGNTQEGYTSDYEQPHRTKDGKMIVSGHTVESCETSG